MSEQLSWELSQANNYFAPQFTMKMWEDHIPHSLIDDVMGVTLHQELDGLFDNDLWEHYNVFKWDYPCIRELNDNIKECYKNFCTYLKIPIEKVWIRGWIYPQKRGMKLDRHIHALHENSYLSGNLCLTQNQTTTDYDIPYIGWVKIDNQKGKMILFPSSIPHASDTLQEDSRYTLAFDLITEQGMDYFWNHNATEYDPLLLATEL